ncbi:DUF5309 domain-containing protein [Agrobacterium tumefaciens]|nr:DUF5309 domain-containing protein [Agrobacterium tumefaciens]
MATLITSQVVNKSEDLTPVIHKVNEHETPFYTSIAKTSAKNTYHEFLSRELAPANKNNAAAEGADAGPATASLVDRKGNWTQIFTSVAQVSGTLEDGIDTIGYSSEVSEQKAVKTVETKRDIEAALVSGNGSVGSGVRKLAGAEAWIATNADHGAGGATPGFSNGLVASVTAGTTRPLTEDMFLELSEDLKKSGGNARNVMVPHGLKTAFAKFSGNADKYQVANKEGTIYNDVGVYVSPHGTFKVLANSFMSETTVIAYDPTLWKIAELRKLTATQLAKTGDSERWQLLTELTLACYNEKGNGKIADVTAA